MADTTAAVGVLLGRLRAGSPDARAELLARAYDRLGRLARGRLRRFAVPAETGDVLHAALIRLDRALGEVRPDSPRAFFGLAARHIRWALLDLAAGRPDPAPAGTDPVDPAPGPAEAAAERDEWARTHRAVDGLAADLREVVDLLVYQGLTQLEAAVVLGVSDRTVKKRWRDARLALADELGGGGAELLDAGGPP